MHKNFFISSSVVIFALLIIYPVFSQNSNEYFAKANSMLTSGNFGKAIEYYNNAIQQNPNFPEAYIGLGIAYKEIGKYDEAYISTSEALKIKPNYYQAYYNIGLILERQSKCKDAIEAYDKFLKEVPGADRFSDVKQRILKLKNNC